MKKLLLFLFLSVSFQLFCDYYPPELFFIDQELQSAIINVPLTEVDTAPVENAFCTLMMVCVGYWNQYEVGWIFSLADYIVKNPKIEYYQKEDGVFLFIFERTDKNITVEVRRK